MTQNMITAAVLTLPLLLQLFGLLFAVQVDPYIRRDHRTVMCIIIAVIFCLILQNLAGYELDLTGDRPDARTVVGIFGYSIRPLILMLFFYIVTEYRRLWKGWVLIGINAAVNFTALFSGICFSIDAANNFHRGPLGYTTHIVSGLLLLQLLYLSYREFRGLRRSESIIPLINALLITLAVLMDSLVDYRLFPVTFLTIAVVSSSVFYYIWLHLQFVRSHERALQAEQRIQIMMTQIQPHFLYNTIATVKALCRKDPQQAAEVADKFGIYLRQNMDSLEAPGCIPFRRELEHTRLYADIEMVRFDHIHVSYDIGDDQFSIPPLTLQPIVENAIRHGVRIREEGIVKVSSRCTETCHEVIVSDNGIGFDPQTLHGEDGKHIGISNVRARIAKLCGGSLQIESQEDLGTTVTIRIPFDGHLMDRI